MRCCAQRALDLGFDAVGLALENPLLMWSTGVSAAGSFLISQLPTIHSLLGIVFTFLVINIIALIYLRMGDVIVHAWRILQAIIRLPIFMIVFRIFLSMWSFLVSILKAEKKRAEKEAEKRGSEANAVYAANTPIMREWKQVIAAHQTLSNYNCCELWALLGALGA